MFAATPSGRPRVISATLGVSSGGSLLSDLAQVSVDACTLNNALNIAQLVVLMALLRWVRSSSS